MKKKINLLVSTTLAIILVILFQNCGESFESIRNSGLIIENKKDTGSTLDPLPVPTDPVLEPAEPTVNPVEQSPEPSPSEIDQEPNTNDPNSVEEPEEEDNLSENPGLEKTISKTFVYMCAKGGVTYGEFDHVTEVYTHLPKINIPNSGIVQWINFDQENKKIITTSLDYGKTKGRLDVFNVVPNGSLSFDYGHDILNEVVHTSVFLSKDNSYYFGFSAYNPNIFQLQLGDVNVGSRNFSSLGQYNTHSSAVDIDRNLIFVANKGGNEVSVFKMSTSGLLEVAKINGVVEPRMLYYSNKYKLLYLVTEGGGMPSYVKIYQIVSKVNDPSLSIVEKSSFQLPGTAGADIKVDYNNNYLLSTVRQANLSGVQYLPLSKNGTLEITSARQAKFVKSLDGPRSLSISSDGIFTFLTFNKSNQKDLTIIKNNYSINKELLNNVKVGDYEVSEDYKACNATISVSDDNLFLNKPLPKYTE